MANTPPKAPAKAAAAPTPAAPAATSAIKIDKGVTMPPMKRQTSTKYPFADMDKGDSFFLPVNVDASLTGEARTEAIKKAQRSKQSSLSSSIKSYRKQAGNDKLAFPVRAVVENDVPGVRVWFDGEKED